MAELKSEFPEMPRSPNAGARTDVWWGLFNRVEFTKANACPETEDPIVLS